MRSTSLLSLAALGAALILAACDKPKDRAPPVQAAATAAQPAAQLPALPAWSGEVVGKAVTDLFPGELKACVGNTDNVEQKYSDGVRIVGWGWDIAAKIPIARVLLADADGRVVGVGETGITRPDVNAAKPEVTSPTTGWSALTHNAKGPINAYGVIDGGKSLCQLGRLEY